MALARAKLFLTRLREQLWFTPALWSLLSVGAVMAALHLGRAMSADKLPDIEAETLNSMLTVIASTMLAISTFSLSILYSAFSFVSSNTSPRATQVITGDPKAHEAISAFIAAFIFSLVALIALGMEWFSAAGRFLLLLQIIVVIALVILALLRWIRTLSLFGKLDYILDRVELMTARAMNDYRKTPWRGCRPGPVRPPTGGPCRISGTGYVKYVDVEALQRLAEAADTIIHIRARGGMLVHPAVPVAIMTPDRVLSPAQQTVLDKAFPLTHERGFAGDPRFGLVVLTEVARRALSNNDPGTAIRSLEAVARILIDTFGQSDSADGAADQPSVEHPRLTMISLRPQDFVTDAFDAVARAEPEWGVQVRMQELLAAVAAACADPIGRAARKQACAAGAEWPANGPARPRSGI